MLSIPGIAIKVLPHLKLVLPHLKSTFSYVKSGLRYLKQLPYELWPYEHIVEEVNTGFVNLRRERNRVRHKVREEENRYGRAIDDDVIKWLQEVDEIISEYDDFRLDEDRPYAVFSDGYLPKPAIRSRLSRIAVDLARRVNILLQSTKNDDFFYWLGPTYSGADFHSFASRNQTMGDIVDALADSNVGVIGVYGWSGVGKTSLIKQVAKEVEENMFDVVIMVNVTSHPDMRSIQGQIADKLGMKLEEESDSGRAAHLRKRLKNPKQKTLIILDNMRVKLDFNMLGIPYEENDGSLMNHKMKSSLSHHTFTMKKEEFDAPSLMKKEESFPSYKGCKILMISESKQLLLSQMDGKGIQTFCVGALTEEEAETMFKNMAEINDENSLLETLVAQIPKTCKGLPMTIVITAKALKNKSLPAWEDALRKLERQNLTAMPEFSTKLSYDLLENEELKQTFLICARMGHDALITDLVRYCIGLSLLEGVYTVREAADRVHALVGELKELSLLCDSFSSDRFTMQDTVRDAALSIASQQMHALTVTKGKLDEWPDMDKLERYSSLSLHQCDMSDIMNEFPKRINCFRLRVFHLDNKDPRLEIPDNFFDEMRELWVLILTGIHLSPLPSSIKCLKKLRMLCLERCKLDEHLSIIGELEKLRVLSLSGSEIESLPVELRRLVKLQIFDISNCFKLKEIPAGLLSSLTSLEELNVGNTPIQWVDEGQGNQSENASISELRQLIQLATLDIQIQRVSNLPKNLFFDKLDSYRIVFRDFNAYWPVCDCEMPETCEASRYLALQLEQGLNIHYQKEIKMLFERVQNLLLGQLNDVEDIFYELNYGGFSQLKYLSIVSNSNVKSIINSKNQKHLQKAFPKLESVFLYEVNNMEHIICHSQLTNDSFCKLKIIKIKMCAQLKNVFFSSMIKHLSALQKIEVSDCNSLKEIVTMETQSIVDEIKFPELRSLTLQSLSEFIGFYTQVPNRKTGELFDEKVVISKLERMELSSIKIQKIWSDQPSIRSCFQNLMHLDVNDCWNLQYLLSPSMSKSLMNLQSLSISECGIMGSIFSGTEDSNIEIEEESIFPRLKTINLRNMRRLKKLWGKFPLYSFGKLDALIIEGCNKLENVIPSYVVGRLQSLRNLKVTNCKSMKEIFDLRGCERRDAEDMHNFQNVHVEALPNLKHVWNKDPKGILNFKKLKKIWVKECVNLIYIFPVSIAMGLEKLEYLEVLSCHKLKEIVSKGGTKKVSSILFEFPKLTTARFWKLPNLESFYGGTHELRCSALANLSVDLKRVFLTKEVICNLKSLNTESHDANWLMKYMENCPTRKLEEFQLSRLVDTKTLHFFLRGNPNLKSLLLSNCFFEQLVPPSGVEDSLGFVPKLKSLKLMNLPSLKMIGFEEDTILFQRLEYLILKECPCLNTIAPSSVSFTCLTNLEVSNCNKLSYLMTPSTAKSLFQLTTMKVIQCESMETIVSEQENEELERIIIFRTLKEIELVALHKLESFCSSNRCAIEFPSLEKVIASACVKMEMFTSSKQVNKTPNLRQIYVGRGEGEKKEYWEGDLNATIQHVCMTRKYFEGMEEMSFSEYPELRQAWQGEVDLQKSWFYSLKILKMVNCDIQPCAIPSNILPHLKSLNELEVQDCNNVEAIFDINFTKGEGIGTTFQLQKLTLQGLSMLIHVWEGNGKGIHSFQNLQGVFVSHCENLQTVFPAVVAKNLKKLDKLHIESCRRLLQIVGKKEGTAVDVTQKFVFPCLTSLHLYDLREIIYFYPELFTLECPVLKKLCVFDCQKLELFESADRQPLFLDLNDISNLEVLLLGWEHTSGLRSKLGELIGCLEYLGAIELLFDVDENEEPILPIEILQKAPNLKEMTLASCHSLEIFLTQVPEVDEHRIRTAHLEILTLKDVSKLQSMDSPLLNRICEKLRDLYVIECPDLTTILHSTTLSFYYLKELYISDCHGLKYLFTSSATKMLMHLENIKVWNCNSIQTIVAKEQDERTSRGIKLVRLNHIDLSNLESLECFYSGNNNLQLPSLIQADIWNCPKMKIFCPGSILANSFKGIKASNLVFYDDLNSSVKKLFLLKEFSDNLYIQPADWPGKVVTLKLDKCSLPCVIPYGILPLLKNLKELEVRDSDKVEVIFYMNDIEIMETTPSQLKKLTLQGLSKLTRVWENNSQGLLIFGNLQEVIISSCKNLQTLFPASLAKNLTKLEKLGIKSCDELLVIVEKEVGTAANETEKFVFPCLEKLDLYDLPQVTNFYPQRFTLKFPALNSLHVSNCDKLELFQSAHSRGEDEDTSTNRQPLISNLKFISNMEKLRLDWKHISELSLRFESEKFAEGLKDLKHIALSFLDADENEMPMLPIEILQKAPNLTEMRMDYCNNPTIGEDGMLGQFTTLTLNDLWNFQSIESESALLNSISKKLNKLKVLQCPRLTTLVDSTSTVSFSCLKKVSISYCPDLQCLFTSSAAKKLMNLEEITVKQCKSVKEIVAKEAGAISEAIKFERLNSIALDSLPSLICFYWGSDTLQLSSLITVHIRECRKMKIFSQGIIYAESFRGIQTSSDPKKDLLVHQDLNAAIKEMLQRQEFFESMDKKCFLDNHDLLADWHGKVGLQNRFLCNLVTLELQNCTLSYAIPSGILLHLKNLEELEVQGSNKVKVIFDMNGTEIIETTSKLKKLTLKGLPRLVRVWEKNSQGVLIFQNLQEVIVSGCKSLQTLFPASLAKNLKSLEELEIKTCDQLQEIVEKDEGMTTNVTEKFVFPQLKILDLCDLPQVSYFYPQTFTLGCPRLNKLSVLDCHKLELFKSTNPKGEGEGRIPSNNRLPLISNQKVISNLKELRLDWKHISALSIRFRSGKFKKGLKDLNEISLYFDADENEKTMLPIEILQKASNLIKMSINYCNNAKIFLGQNLEIGVDRMLGQLKVLTLCEVSTIRSMETEDSSWLNTICEKLHELNVDSCPRLTILVHTVSFSFLKKVSISNCPNLKYLFTYSAAKKLVNLEEITVLECESVKEIVVKEGDEDQHKGEGGDECENEMIFKKLRILILYTLPNIESFYTGSSTLNFPSLKVVKFIQCYTTKLFHLGDKVPMIFKVTIDGVDWEGDINSVIMQLFEEEAA